MEYILYIYIGGASIVLLTSIFAVQAGLKAMARRRRKAVDNLKNSEAIPTTTPFDKPLSSFKAKAKVRINARFTIFRKVAYFIGLTALLIVLSFPFIDSLPKAFVSILVTSAAVIIGIAARPFIENFLSGIAITTSKMLGIGDTVILNGNYGKIEDISATHTIIKLWDWRRYVIPNSRMINHEFINYSLNDQWIWAHVEFWVSYEEDLDQIKEWVMQIVLESPHYAEHVEPPAFWVMATEKDAIKCWVAAWANSPSSAWELAADLRMKIAKRFQEHGVKTHFHEQRYHKGEASSFSL